MKYVILLCDGMADYPIQSLNNKTPLEFANTPNMDMLCKNAEIGLVKTVPDSMSPGSDVANLSVMGYDPKEFYTGRSPLEAANMGIELNPEDMTLRCNLVTLSDDDSFENKTMVDYCAGDISTEEAAEIIKTVNEHFGKDGLEFYPGVSYRHCLVVRNCENELGNFTPPHDISKKVIDGHINPDINAAKLVDIMKKSGDLLKNHPVNIKRIAEGKKPATNVWFWGPGRKPALKNFFEKTGLKGGVVSAVDLIKGIGRCAEMQVADIEGATGYIDTNFEGKMNAAVDMLKNGCDYVYIHVEAPDECGHRGECENKIKAIEYIDSKLLSPLLDYLNNLEDFAIAILPDHPTPLSIMTHCSDPVPYLVYKKSKKLNGADEFNEKNATNSGVYIEEGHTLINRMMNL